MKCAYTSKRAQAAIARILAALATDRLSSRDLAEKVCLSQNSAYRYLVHLQEEPRRVRIAGYAPGIGPTAPLYGLGSAPNAKRRKKRTRAERFRALKADHEKYQRDLALRRLSNLRAKTAKSPQTPFSALFTRSQA